MLKYSLLKGRKLRAGALQYVLIWTVLVAALLLLALNLAHIYMRHRDSSQLTLEQIHRLKSVAEGLCTDTAFIRQTRPWGGVYQVCTVRESSGHLRTQAYLLGSYNKKYADIALYLSEAGTPLSISGRSAVDAKAYLPAKGHILTSFGGNRTNTDSIHFEQVFTSEEELPGIELPNPRYTPAGITVLLEADAAPQEIAVSFADTTYVLYSASNIRLNHITLKGNVVVKSEKNIIVQAEAYLQDVLLEARRIIVEDGTKGNFHALARENISVGKEVCLGYPSSLCIVPDTASEPETAPQITLGEGTDFSGVILNTYGGGNKKEASISIDKAKVAGQLYNRSHTEISGEFTGNLFTAGFIKVSGYTNYLNLIDNLKIKALPEPFFPGFCLSQKEGQILSVTAKTLY